MEIRPTIETLVQDTVAVGKFIGKTLIGGAYAELANIVLQAQPDESNIIKGEE